MCFEKLLRRAVEKQTKSFKIHEIWVVPRELKVNITPKIPLSTFQLWNLLFLNNQCLRPITGITLFCVQSTND